MAGLCLAQTVVIRPKMSRPVLTLPSSLSLHDEDNPCKAGDGLEGPAKNVLPLLDQRRREKGKSNFLSAYEGEDRLLETGSAPRPPSAAAATAAAATPAIVGAGPRLVHVQRPPLQLFAVHAADGRLSLFFPGHFDKSESLGLVAELVLDNGNRRNLAERLKGLFQIVFRHTVR
jgi:hypothetical protein